MPASIISCTVVEESLEGHVIPGDECPVFDTDFGRLGVQTCFDIGWRDGWKQLADQGAQLVVWSAAYDGGNLLNAYAALHMYYVVSTVRTDHARIIDLTGAPSPRARAGTASPWRRWIWKPRCSTSIASFKKSIKSAVRWAIK